MTGTQPPLWIAEEDRACTERLVRALDRFEPIPKVTSLDSLLESPHLLRNSLVLVGIRQADERIERVLSDIEGVIEHGTVWLAGTIEGNSAHRVVPIEALGPRLFAMLVSCELSRISAEVKRSTAEAERDAAVEFGRILIAGMAHDLKSPLNAIIGFAELLVRHVEEEPEGKTHRYATNIAGAGRHLLELVDDIVELSRIEAGNVEARPSSCSVSSLLQDCVKVLGETAHRHGVAIELDPESVQEAKLSVDRRMVRQALFLLCIAKISAGTLPRRLHMGADAFDRDSVRIRIRLVDNEGGVNGAGRRTERPTMPIWQQHYIRHVVFLNGGIVREPFPDDEVQIVFPREVKR